MSTLARSVTILGATGSIGESTAAVIEDLREGGAAIHVEAIVGGRDVAALAAMAARLGARFAAVAEPERWGELRAALKAAGSAAEAGAGPQAVIDAAAMPADWVMSAIVGAAALAPTMAAIRRGATVALANKECMVCAGPLMLAAAKAHGAQLLPVDSEHNAIFQVLTHPKAVERLILTATGGPFRTWTREAMAKAGPEAATAHPRWKMGAKISVDSASLMNKGLELIEAAYLFGVPETAIDIVIHPEAIVHSLVSYIDGSVLAQLSEPDMRVPIAYALAWPERAAVSTRRLDLAAIGALHFEAPDAARFPALRLARAALAAGEGAPAVLNAANEIAVDAFLKRRINFLDIPAVVGEVLDAGAAGFARKAPCSFDEVAAIDAEARVRAEAGAAARAV